LDRTKEIRGLEGDMRMVFVLFIAVLFVSTLFSSIETVRNEEYLASQKKIKGSFCCSIYCYCEEAKEIILSHFPHLASDSDDEICAIIEERDIQRRFGGNSWKLSSQLEGNLFYRDLEFVSQEKSWTAWFDGTVRFILSEYYEAPLGFAVFKTGLYPYFDIRSFLVELQVEDEERAPPDSGYLRIWLLLPPHSLIQDYIEVLKVFPPETLASFPRIDWNIGCALFEFDLASIIGNLEITIVFTFRQHLGIAPASVKEL